MQPTRLLREMTRHVAIPLIICCFALIGCSESQKTIVRKGSVVFDGRPVFPGSIILKDDQGTTISGNLNSAGDFTIRNARKTKYAVAIQTQKLADLSRVQASTENQDSDEKTEVVPERREDIVPDKFRNANVDIPEKYRSFKTSGLTIDFTEGKQDEPVKIVLE